MSTDVHFETDAFLFVHGSRCEGQSTVVRDVSVIIGWCYLFLLRKQKCPLKYINVNDIGGIWPICELHAATIVRVPPSRN